MSKLVANMSMSLDGYVADTSDRIDHLLNWYVDGDTPVRTPDGNAPFTVGENSAKVLDEAMRGIGAILGGRRYFDLADGWGGSHPMGPTFILTHQVPDGWPREGSNISFVTDGLHSAVEQAKQVAGDRFVAVATPDLVRQTLDAGLLDEISIDLVPVLLGDGVPYFASLKQAPRHLDGPSVVQGNGVTHLVYRVR